MYARRVSAPSSAVRVHRRQYGTPEEAQHDIARYIEGWYNPRRRHSALGYLSPKEYEEQWAA
jgi:putative transposase